MKVRLAPGESILYEARPSWHCLWSPLGGTLVAIAAGIAVEDHLSFLVVLLALAPLRQFAEAALGLKYTRLVLTDRRVILTERFLEERTRAVERAHVAGISVTQGPFSRLAGVWTVTIETTAAGTDTAPHAGLVVRGLRAHLPITTTLRTPAPLPTTTAPIVQVTPSVPA